MGNSCSVHFQGPSWFGKAAGDATTPPPLGIFGGFPSEKVQGPGRRKGSVFRLTTEATEPLVAFSLFSSNYHPVNGVQLRSCHHGMKQHTLQSTPSSLAQTPQIEVLGFAICVANSRDYITAQAFARDTLKSLSQAKWSAGFK